MVDFTQFSIWVCECMGMGIALRPIFFCFVFFFNCLLLLIITHQQVVGCSELCSSLRTLSALSARVRRCDTIKKTLVLSGKMKRRAR